MPRCEQGRDVGGTEPRRVQRQLPGIDDVGPHTPWFASLRLTVRTPFQLGCPRSSSPLLALLVKFRRHLQAVALRLVMVDPERRLFLREYSGDALHRRLGL